MWPRAQRSGATKPVLGADDPTQRAPGKGGFHLKYDFRETIAFPVTLYKARGVAVPRGCAFEQHHRLPPLCRLTAHAAQESDGPRKYAKKTLTLTVCETASPDGKNATDVGSIVLNLAEFASTDGADNDRRLPLACSAAITAAVGQPMLACTIRRAPPAGCPQRRGPRVPSRSLLRLWS